MATLIMLDYNLVDPQYMAQDALSKLHNFGCIGVIGAPPTDPYLDAGLTRYVNSRIFQPENLEAARNIYEHHYSKEPTIIYLGNNENKFSEVCARQNDHWTGHIITAKTTLALRLEERFNIPSTPNLKEGNLNHVINHIREWTEKIKEL